MLEFHAICFFVFGAIFGSFANVLIVRLPENKNIIPRSACPRCQAPIAWYHNIPIFSWLWLRGRCRQCGEKFSVQYLIVELTMALLFTAAFLKLGWSWYLFEFLIFAFGSVTASFIDIKHYILPDVFTLGGLVVGLLGAAINPERSFWDAVIGFLVGGGFLYLTAYVHFLLRGIEGMGGGDIKLLAWIGAVMGWQSLIFVFLVSAVTGSIFGLGRAVIFRKDLKDPIPFGPFITLAALLYVLVGSRPMVQSLLELM